MNFPGTRLKVKIVLSISFHGTVLNAGLRRVWILLREPLRGLQDESEAANQEIGSNIFDVHRHPFKFACCANLTWLVVCHNSHSSLLRYDHFKFT